MKSIYGPRLMKPLTLLGKSVSHQPFSMYHHSELIGLVFFSVVIHCNELRSLHRSWTILIGFTIHCAIIWSAVCDCRISWSYSLAFLLHVNNKGQTNPSPCLALVVQILESIMSISCWIQIFNILASLCSWADWFESCFVEVFSHCNPFTVNSEISARTYFRICKVSWKKIPREMARSLCRLLI